MSCTEYPSSGQVSTKSKGKSTQIGRGLQPGMNLVMVSHGLSFQR